MCLGWPKNTEKMALYAAGLAHAFCQCGLQSIFGLWYFHYCTGWALMGSIFHPKALIRSCKTTCSLLTSKFQIPIRFSAENMAVRGCQISTCACVGWWPHQWAGVTCVHLAFSLSNSWLMPQRKIMEQLIHVLPYLVQSCNTTTGIV